MLHDALQPLLLLMMPTSGFPAGNDGGSGGADPDHDGGPTRQHAGGRRPDEDDGAAEAAPGGPGNASGAVEDRDAAAAAFGPESVAVAVVLPEDGISLSRIDNVSENTPQETAVAEMLSRTIDVHAFAPAVELLDAPDAADALEDLGPDDAADVVHVISDERAAQNLAEMQPNLAIMVLEDLAVEHGPREPARYIALMDPDDAVDLLQEMEESFRQQLLSAMPPAKAVQLERLGRYDPETAGGMMTTDFISIGAHISRREAVGIVRSGRLWDFNHIYCVDDQEHLVGFVTLRQLLLSTDEELIEEIMNREVEVIPVDLDREEIAEAFERYDYTVMPVVDAAHRLLGVVTVDDVIDIIREEANEDAYKMVGAGSRETVFNDLRQKLSGRFPWLVVNLFTSFVAAMVVLTFEGLISDLALLAVLMPMIANQAGNAGQQSLAVTLRGLVLGEVRGERVWSLLSRETLLGIVAGLIVGALLTVVISILGWTGLVESASPQLGLVAAIAMTGSLGVGCLVGTGMPILMERLNRDPATASTIFLTMVTDSVSFFTFLGLAWAFKSVIIPE